MKKIALIFITSFLSILITFGQNPKSVNAFPEDYIGKTLTFNNIRYWPILKEFGGYYSVQIDIATSINKEREWGFAGLDKIIGVVEKDIAKQMIKKNIGGYNSFYSGAVTGTIIKSNKIFGSSYIFVISKIINYPPNDPNSVKNIFTAH